MSSEFFKRIHVQKKADDIIAEFLRIPIIIPEFNSGILRLSYCGLRAQRFMSTTCENSLLVIFFSFQSAEELALLK